MTVIISGTDGVSDVDGTAGTPALRGTDANTGIFFPAADTIAFAEGGAEAMRINSSGQVGIGTTSFSRVLTVAGTSFNNCEITRYSDSAGGPNLFIQKSRGASVGTNTVVQNNDAAGNITFAAADGTDFIACASISAAIDGTPGTNDMPGRLVFNTTADGASSVTERARITSAGTLGVLNGGGGAGDNTFGLNHPEGSSSTTWFILGNHTATTTLNNTGTSAFRVATNGNVTNLNGTYGTISDLKLKQDIVDANSQWNDIKNLRFRKYRLKSEVEANPDAKPLLGLVAQEVEQVSPHLVENFPDFEDVEVTGDDGDVTIKRQETGTNTKALKTSVLYMKAVKALQEAIERIETLEASNTALEARIAALEAK